MRAIERINPFTQTKLTHVAVYCRVSTDRESQLHSLENQKNHFQQVLAEHPDWQSAGFYSDAGVSGTSASSRPALMALLNACRHEQIDIILTKSISRFARNTMDFLSLIKELRSLNVQVYFERENLYTSSYEGDLMLSVLASMAEEESRSISENCRWTIQKHFQNGTFKLSRPPYGYRLEDGQLTPEPSEARIVRAIYNDTINGLGTPTIAQNLNAACVPTKRGGTWQAGTILHMISNELYMGDMRLQKTWRDDHYRPHLNHGERQQYYLSNHHPPIVSREIFQQANDVLRSRDTLSHTRSAKDAADPRQNRYSFTGKLKCVICSASLVRKHRRLKGNLVPGWVCREHLKDSASCASKWLPEEQIWSDLLKICFLLGTNQHSFLKEQLSHSGISDQKAKELKRFAIKLASHSPEDSQHLINNDFSTHFHHLTLDMQQLRCFFQCGLQICYDRVSGGLYGD